MAARPALRLAALLLLRGQARGIVRRDDVDPQLYATTPAAYQGAVLMLNPDGDAPGKPGSRRFNVECAATMISREHLVTAAHCLCDDDASSTADGARLRTTPGLWVEKQHYPVTVAGEKHTVVASYLNQACKFKCSKDGPNRCDVAVLKLARPVVTSAMTPYPVYNRSDEVGKRVQMVGWGVTGTANNISKRDCNNGPEDGVFRHAENVVTAANGVIEYKMDSPPQALPLEGISASGDSGGPLFLTDSGNVTFIAGVNSGSDDKNGCIYGSTDQFNRLSEQYAFIQHIVAGGPDLACNTMLQKLCGKERSAGVFACAQCSGLNQHALQKAGCDNEKISVWCAGVPPPPPPPPPRP